MSWRICREKASNDWRDYRLPADRTSLHGMPLDPGTTPEPQRARVTSQHSTPREIREQAAEWAVLLSDGPLAAEQEAALALWLEADPRHAQALTFARDTWAALAQAPASPLQPRRQRSAAQRQRPARRRSRVTGGPAAAWSVPAPASGSPSSRGASTTTCSSTTSTGCRPSTRRSARS